MTLSKRLFVAGLQCAKRLHLEHVAPELRDAGQAGREALAAAGIEVGVAARERFPRGRLIAGETWDGAVAATRAALADPAIDTLFEAAFEEGGARARPDVLVRAADGFEVLEVKSALRVRDQHATDLAYQVAVLRAAGLAVTRAGLLLLDRTYVHPGGAFDLERLFVRVDLTAAVESLAATVRDRLEPMRDVLAAGEPPAVAIGAHCLVPDRCPFFGHCHAGGPAHPVTDLPRLTGEQLGVFVRRGIDDLRSVPADFPGLTPMQARACRAARRGGPVREPALVDKLAAIPRPAHFVDFETFASALPVYPGTRPFEQVPFQWSDHVLAIDGAVTHREFLHDANDDPRRAFAESLLAATADAAALVVYSRFEGDVLSALAGALPDLGVALLERRERIVDLLPLVRDHCAHPALRGSFSIKRVLPAFVPGLGYDDLAIRDGLSASRAHAALVDPALDPARRAELRTQLLAYCARDTWAMVELHRVLGAHAGLRDDPPRSP
ncbi:MAG: DUF2779 domain-containing protein [Deltaproteobacteria bacterium]|nr:DUF2779 domain-containing protein [Deltaproteobacteria bacterium]